MFLHVKSHSVQRRPLRIDRGIRCNGIGSEVPHIGARRFLIPAAESVTGRGRRSRLSRLLTGLNRL